jgi:peptide/nickel transport system ATP-binding protein
VIVEHGPTARVLTAPAHEYTRSLLAAVPSARSRGALLGPPRAAARYLGATRTGTQYLGATRAASAPRPAEQPVLQAKNLVKRFARPDGSVHTVVNDVSFTVHAGEILGVVGESGSGKTTTARIALALTRPDTGSVLLHGRPWSALTERQRRALRPSISTIYQDPLSSFDPRWSVRRILTDSLETAPRQDAGPHSAQRLDRVVELLELVGLDAGHLERRPARLSGGQRQRVAIARALAPEPQLIVCDEPVSALDVSIQAQVLDLLSTLRERLGVGYLFISHDLGVIHHLSDRVLVMKDGRIVEHGSAEAVFNSPKQPYTRRLLESVPTLGTGSLIGAKT